MSVDALTALLAPLELSDRRVATARLEAAFLAALSPAARVTDAAAAAEYARELEARTFARTRAAGHHGHYDVCIAAYVEGARSAARAANSAFATGA